MTLRPLGIAICLAGCLAISAQAAQFEVQQDADGVTVNLNGKLLTRYLVKSGIKPILWPIIGPYGDAVTRQYPMDQALPDEKSDHPHQRSFWFTHGDVNGVSFWHEGAQAGHIVHKEFLQVVGGETAVVVARNEWLTADGKKTCEDVRTLTFGTCGEHVWIDFDSTVTATDGPVKFGDTKEGSFGVRVAGTMDVDKKLGGRIVNSHGVTDKDAWAKQAPWVDYHGPVHGKTVGIAILNHPTSFRFPTYWHVRTYGLFTANPFGVKDFTGGPDRGDHELAPGESFTLRYRVLIHKGDEKEGGVAEAYEAYAKTAKP
jgi:hypothetical protein